MYRSWYLLYWFVIEQHEGDVQHTGTVYGAYVVRQRDSRLVR